MQELTQNAPIIDKYFHECLKKVSQEHNSNLRYHVIRTSIIGLVFFLHCYVIPPENQDMKQTFTFFMQLLFSQSFFQVVHLLNFTFSQLRNKTILVSIANNLQHCLSFQNFQDIQQEQLTGELFAFQLDVDLGLKVSQKIYDFENMQKMQDVSEQNRKIRENIGCRALSNALQSHLCCYKGFGCLFQTSGAGIMIYSIVIVIQFTLPTFQSTFIQFYFLFEVMLKPKIFAILVIICLLPLILLVVSIYVCCCKKQQKVELPKTQQVSLQSLSNCSQCAICFQNFVEGQKIVPLDCSQKHIFHEICITGWAKIKPTCPICRSQI